jgi:hypothetical protein
VETLRDAANNGTVCSRISFKGKSEYKKINSWCLIRLWITNKSIFEEFVENESTGQGEVKLKVQFFIPSRGRAGHWGDDGKIPGWYWGVSEYWPTIRFIFDMKLVCSYQDVVVWENPWKKTYTRSRRAGIWTRYLPNAMRRAKRLATALRDLVLVDSQFK